MTTYYDRFDPAKRWKKLQFVAGRRLQSAEVNEIQSLLMESDRRLGDALFGSGNILDGCQPIIASDKKSVLITDGHAYIDGVVVYVGEQTVVITGSGTESIGIMAVYSTATYETDPTLLDPAVGAENYGLPGSDRLVLTPTWVKDSADASQVFKFIDGVLVQSALPPELEGITPILARRTYDTNGSFLVSGMGAWIEERDGFPDTVALGIEAGAAYVQGFEIRKLAPERVVCNKAKDTLSVVNETKTYLTGTTTYALNNKPVAAVSLLSATVEITESVSRGNTPGSADLLPHTPVVSIISASYGGTTYTQGTDYQLVGNTIDWSLGGAEPGSGVTYSVTYRFTKSMVLGTDFSLSSDSIVFLSGDLPVSGTTFQVSYTFYVGRRDLMYLTRDGEFKVLTGDPAITPPLPPDPVDVLVLAEIYYPANGDAADVVVTNRSPKRLTMQELQYMYTRIRRAEYNLAIQTLDTTAQTMDPTVARLGTFTDNFTTTERSDLYHASFDAVLDTADAILQLPYEQEYDALAYSAANTTARVHETKTTQPYTEVVALSQLKASDLMNVNPYGVITNICTIRPIPGQDYWVVANVLTRTINGASWTGTVENVLEDVTFDMRQIDVVVRGEGFEPNGADVYATFDGKPVALTPLESTPSGVAAGTIKGKTDGTIVAQFTIPSGVRSGTREILLYSVA